MHGFFQYLDKSPGLEGACIKKCFSGTKKVIKTARRDNHIPIPGQFGTQCATNSDRFSMTLQEPKLLIQEREGYNVEYKQSFWPKLSELVYS